jgi:uncharacterized protein YciI
MQFFAWGINKPNIKEKRATITETHWKFWDQYDDRLISRGPVLNPNDPSTALGSIHILELKHWDDAQPILVDEPYAKAGLFEEIILKGFSLELDRTQFEFKGTPGSHSFFIYCPAKNNALEEQVGIVKAHNEYCLSHDERFICRGSLLTKDGNWDGSVFFIDACRQVYPPSRIVLPQQRDASSNSNQGSTKYRSSHRLSTESLQYLAF